MSDPSQPVRRRRLVGVLVLAAIAVVLAVVVAWALTALTLTAEPAPVASSATPSAHPVPDATVSSPETGADVLEAAAVLAEHSAGTALAPTGYLQVTYTTQQLVLYAADAPGSPFDATRSQATAAWVEQGEYAIYIPADRSGEWVQIMYPEREVIALYGQDAELHASEWAEAFAGFTEPDVYRVTGGLSFDDGGDEPPRGSDAYYARMPLDPAELLEWNRQRMIDGNVEAVDEGVVGLLLQDLALNAAPAPLRASMFRALSLVPGVEVLSVDGDLTTLGFGYDHWDNGFVTMTIDTVTGLLVAETTTWSPGPGIVPEDVPGFSVTVATAVVDEVP